MNTLKLKNLNSEKDVDLAMDLSESTPIFIYKHSPICGQCDSAIIEWENFLKSESKPFGFYQVDVLDARNASQKIAGLVGIRHESPQILVIYKAKCIWHGSHRNVKAAAIKSFADSLT